MKLERTTFESSRAAEYFDARAPDPNGAAPYSVGTSFTCLPSTGILGPIT